MTWMKKISEIAQSYWFANVLNEINKANHPSGPFVVHKGYRHSLDGLPSGRVFGKMRNSNNTIEISVTMTYRPRSVGSENPDAVHYGANVNVYRLVVHESELEQSLGESAPHVHRLGNWDDEFETSEEMIQGTRDGILKILNDELAFSQHMRLPPSWSQE
jgi:hypothetical protein